MSNKVKAKDPHIVVSGNIDKPYYSIRYYDLSDNTWHIGFSSYELKFVVQWLKEEFEIVESDIEPVRRGKWIGKDNEEVPVIDGSPKCSCYCSLCGDWLVASDEYPVKGNYCPNCGAKMYLGDD